MAESKDFRKATEAFGEARVALASAANAVGLDRIVKGLEELLDSGALVRWEIRGTRTAWDVFAIYPTPWDDRPVREGGRSAAILPMSIARSCEDDEALVLAEEFFADLALLAQGPREMKAE